MKVLRFMSAEEAVKLLLGIKLENYTNHAQAGRHTTSVGFCFAILPDTPGDVDDVFKCAQYLSGNSILHLCLVAELKPDVKYRRTAGHYSFGKQKELCTKTYSLDDFTGWRLYSPTEVTGIVPVIYSGNYRRPNLVVDNMSFRGMADAVHTS